MQYPFERLRAVHQSPHSSLAPSQSISYKMASHRQRARERALALTQIKIAPRRTLWLYSQILLTILVTLSLAALSAEVSKLSLTPVYGSIPPRTSLNWLRGGLELDQRYIAIVISVALAKMYLSNHALGFSRVFAIWGFSIPSIQSGLSSFSGKLGPIWGPRSTYLLTSVPLTCLSLLYLVILIPEAFPLTIFAKRAATRSTKEFCSNALGTLLLTSTLYHFLSQLQVYFEIRIPTFVMLRLGKPAVFSRFSLQTIITLMYASLAASLQHFKVFFAAILPLLHIIFVCPHLRLPYNTNILNNTIQAQGFSLVARQESLTGYISVLDNVDQEYRVMRCDHSLLGGEYLRKPKGSRYNEPVYTIFLTLEAVRLLQTKPPESQLPVTSEVKHAVVM